MDTLFDIVIPVGPNDVEILEKMIQYTQKNIVGYRCIFLISFDPNLQVDSCITIDEKMFPFNKKHIAKYIGVDERNGWYLQQLLKLYAGFVIDNILDNYLVIDVDTFFLHKTTFFNKDGLPLYNTGKEYHPPYFGHMKKLHSGLIKKSPFSGICHHMMFQKHVLCGLFKFVESQHLNEPFYISFLKSIDLNHSSKSGASEYEIYYNYLHIHHNNDFRLRELKWANFADSDKENIELDYISYHYYNRPVQSPWFYSLY